MITISRNEHCVGEIQRRDEFKNKGMTMSAKWHTEMSTIERGCLDDENWLELQFLAGISNAIYVVYSYETPIVAVTNFGDTWECTQWFSSTTTRHKNLFKRGL